MANGMAYGLEYSKPSCHLKQLFVARAITLAQGTPCNILQELHPKPLDDRKNANQKLCRADGL